LGQGFGGAVFLMLAGLFGPFLYGTYRDTASGCVGFSRCPTRVVHPKIAEPVEFLEPPLPPPRPRSEFYVGFKAQPTTGETRRKKGRD
jgi:hypothetical protein